ncbi:ABC transporter permease, partial [Frankia sp. Cpl3]|nr:ABC transporter permease [Frankia sp. Cpl3]
DRKTIIGTFIIPILVIPLVFLLLSSAMSSVQRDAKAYIPLVVDADMSSPLAEKIKQTPGVVLFSEQEPLPLLREGKIRAVVHIPADFEKSLQTGSTAQVKLWYDPANDKSSYARGLLEKVVSDYEAQIVTKRLKAVGLSANSIHPIETVTESVATDEKMAGKLLSGIIPLMLVLSMASGGIAASTDLVAGEKERGTLESLISAPIPTGSILTAKLLAVMMMCGISAIASLISMVILFSVGPMGSGQGAFTLSFLQPLSIIVFLLMLLLLAATFAGLELAISTWAKTFKEAQTYMTPVVLAAMVPSYMMLPLYPVDIPLH